MSTSGPDDLPPPSELQGLDPKDLLQAGLETVPPVTLPPQSVDPDATVPVARPQSTQPAPQVELPLPEELTQLLPVGAYHVESFLGQGGMGAVYKASQVRLKRPVAIKIMRRDMGKDYDFEARFEREAQAMAKLNHPNIVSVIDFGEAGPDYLYIVMELIDGADLMDVIRGGQMTQEMALTLLPQVCDALQFAHDHGIVHRDIKPSNIMLTRDGRVKMCDFGLAKRYDVESSFRTQTGTGMGTPDYAAPEQFDPKANIDHRADIYALGVMIYQMITGQLPRGVWKPPSQRAEVAPAWDDIVSRAMQSDPSDRYQHASDIKTDVSSIPLGAKSDAGTPARKESAAAGRLRSREANARSTSESPPAARALASTPTKSRAPLLFGLITSVVVITAGAFFALKKPQQSGPLNPSEAEIASQELPEGRAERGNPLSGMSGANAPDSAQGTVRTTFVSIPGLPDLPPLNIPPGEPGLVKEILLSGSLIRKVAVLPDSRRVVVVRDSATDLIDMETGSSIWTMDGGIATACALTPDGLKFVDYRLLQPDGQDFKGGKGEITHARITLRETANGKALQSWKVPAGRMSSSSGQVAMSPSGQVIVARVASGDTKDGRSTRFVALRPGVEEPFAVLDAVGHAGHTIHCLDEDSFLSTGAGAPFFIKPSKPQENIPVPDSFTHALFGSSLSPQKNWLIVSEDLVLKVWGMKDKKPLIPLQDRPKGGFDFGTFAGEEIVVNIEGEQKMMAWSTATGRVLASHPQPKAGYQFASACSGAPNGDFFVATAKPSSSATSRDTFYLQIFSLPKPEQAPGQRTSSRILPAPAAGSVSLSTIQPFPSPSPAVSKSSTVAASKDAPFTNTLGMKFVPVPGTKALFCIHETRYRDYQTYAAETKLAGDAWKDQTADGFTPTTKTAEHPVMNVSWQEAKGFCDWLSKKEGVTYRLPTDAEWSLAVGLAHADNLPMGTTPAMLSGRDKSSFPWGGDFPPKTADRAGNYGDASKKAKAPRSDIQYLEDYDDGFPTTAPVMSFKPNALGLYDLGGNVWEWCEDWIDDAHQDRVLRGGSWLYSDRAHLLSSHRGRRAYNDRSYNDGFRVVLEPAASPAAVSPSTNLPVSSSPSTATKTAPFINTLGMKFVPVPITRGPTDGKRVLFSVWDVRVRDFETFVTENGYDMDRGEKMHSWREGKYGLFGESWHSPGFKQTAEHPVVGMSWEDAKAFCEWLTKRERSAARIGLNEEYRLPSDHEWSCAVGIGDREDPKASPKDKNGKIKDVFPWGTQWPPPKGAGNYGDDSAKKVHPAWSTIDGYDDGFAATSPVGVFPANQFGLFDMSGNVWQWCEDLWESGARGRVIRGGSFGYVVSSDLLSSCRSDPSPTSRVVNFGFRCVLAPARIAP